LGLILFRTLRALAVFGGVATLTWIAIFVVGDPVRIIGAPVPPQVARTLIEERLELHRPLHERYLTFLAGLPRGEIGPAFRYRGRALEVAVSRIGPTLEIVGAVLLLVLIVGVPLGLLHARRAPGGVGAGLLLSAQVTPQFWLALMFVLVFGAQIGWLAPVGRISFEQVILPALTLGAAAVSMTALQTAAAVSAAAPVLAGGVLVEGPPVSLRRPSSAAGVLRAVTRQVPLAFAGALAIETIFYWPGMGRLAVEALARRDILVFQGAVLVIAAIVIAVDLVVDLITGLIAVRKRHG
jgi:ABC-type dipeptide/oligopeptide/nickel transport system permease component